MVVCILFFTVGLGISVAWTETVAAVRDKRPVAAGLWTFVLDAATMGATWWAIEANSIPSLLAYSAGGGLGTALSIIRSCR